MRELANSAPKDESALMLLKTLHMLGDLISANVSIVVYVSFNDAFIPCKQTLQIHAIEHIQ